MKFRSLLNVLFVSGGLSVFLSCQKEGLTRSPGPASPTSSKRINPLDNKRINSLGSMGGAHPFPGDTSVVGARLWADDGTDGEFHTQYFDLSTRPGVTAWNFARYRTVDKVLVCSAGDNPDNNSDPKNMLQFFSNTQINWTQYCGTPLPSYLYPYITFSVYLTGQDGTRKAYDYSVDPFIGQGIITYYQFGPVGGYVTGQLVGTFVERFHPSHILNASATFKLPRVDDYTAGF